MGFLIGGEAVGGMLSAGRIKGFDLSSFNEFAPPRLVVPLNGVAFETLSADVELLRFELGDAEFPMGGREVALPVTGSGLCYGVALWIRLDLDDTVQYSNRPGGPGGNSHWPNIIYRFPAPLMVSAGESVRVFARHDRAEINLELLTPQSR